MTADGASPRRLTTRSAAEQEALSPLTESAQHTIDEPHLAAAREPHSVEFAEELEDTDAA
jgi:hypothetical protein